MTPVLASELLIAARTREGLSQADLARRAGIPRSVLNVYERGKREPGVGALAAILAAAGYELTLSPLIDLEWNARIFADVLELAESLPWKPKRSLAYPRFAEQVA